METEAEAPRPRLHPLVRIALFITAYVVVNIVVSVVVFTAVHLMGVYPSGAGAGMVLLGMFVVLAPAALGLTWVFARFLDRRSLGSLGVRWPGGALARLRGALSGAALALVLVGAWTGAMVFIGAFHVHGISGPARTAAGVVALVVAFAGFLVQGATEELLIRGYVFHVLAGRWSGSIAAVVSSLLFAAMHLMNPHFEPAAFVNTFLVGMVLVSLVRRSKSLWSASFLHGTWNYLIACIVSVPVSGLHVVHLLSVDVVGPAAATGGSYGPEASWALTLPLAVVALLTIPRERRR